MKTTNKKIDIVLLTKKEYLVQQSETDYIKNVLLEDRLLAASLKKMGYQVTRKSWDDPNFDWSSTKAILFRATWDYFHRFSEFSPWLDSVRDQTISINSIDLIRWNMHKFYLQELSNQGVHVPPALYIKRNDKRVLEDVVLSTPWDELILKPAVSGAARHTYLLNKSNATEYNNIFQDLIEKEDMILQEFQPSIREKGEISLIVFGGKFSHAVLKRAKKGDFRVQDDFGGSVHVYQPKPSEIKLAENIVQKCPSLPIYARVDIFWNQKDEPLLAELELIEPELWFRECQSASDDLARAVRGYLNKNYDSH